MSFLPALEEAFQKYFQHNFSELEFQIYETKSEGPGALMSFKNDLLKLQLVNDRGLINLAISPAFEENFFDAELVNSLLQLEMEENLKLGQFSRRQLLMKRLDLEEQSNLIYNNWGRLIIIFNLQSFDFTKSKFEKLGLERAEIMFGKNLFQSK